MTKVPYTCRLCNKPGTAEAPHNYNPETHGEWVPLLCHDPCWDIRDTRLRCEEKFVNLCLALERIKPLQYKGKSDDLEKIRKALEESCRRWSHNESRHAGSHVTYWQPEFLAMLMDFPDSIVPVIRTARDYIRTKCHEEFSNRDMFTRPVSSPPSA